MNLILHNLSQTEKRNLEQSARSSGSLQNIEHILQEVLQDKQAKLLRKFREQFRA